MNQVLLDSASMQSEGNDDTPAGLDASAGSLPAPQNDARIIESLLAPVMRRLGRPPSSIFYIEIGGGAVPGDNTERLYRQHGARGVLVEANHPRALQLKAGRPQDQVIEAAVVARDVAATGQGGVAPLPINDLLARYGDRQIDVLCVDCGGDDSALLEAMDFGKHRPSFIQCGAREQSAPGAVEKGAAMLEACGYFLIARTEASQVFADRALLLPAGNRRAIRSFDVFDTLIARNCIDPHRIFARVEALTKHAGFMNDRVKAEQAVAVRAYNLDDIYAELAKIRGWSQDVRDAAQAAEIFFELEAVVPIAENLARVRDGDIAVSDMYLPEVVIRMLLKKAGLTKEIGVVVSSHGKRSGEIWPFLLADYQIEQHLGDNHAADVASPGRFGIASRHTSVASPDEVEAWFIKHGLRDLAQITRQARLSSWHENATVRELQLIQIRFNFPILLLSSILLARFVAAGNIRDVLFCSRDCNLWMEIFRVVRTQMGVQANEVYFYTSRLARMKATPSYRRYANELLQNGGVLVDICGTGWSLAHMMQSLGQRNPLYFIHHLPPMDAYEKMRPTPAGIDVHSIVDGRASGVGNEPLEMCNYADHPQVVDVSYIRNAAHPVFAPERRSQFTLDMVREQRGIFRRMVTLCEAQGLAETLSVPDDTLRAMVLELYKSLCGQKLLPLIYQAMHAEEETDQMRLLRSIA